MSSVWRLLTDGARWDEGDPASLFLHLVCVCLYEHVPLCKTPVCWFSLEQRDSTCRACRAGDDQWTCVKPAGPPIFSFVSSETRRGGTVRSAPVIWSLHCDWLDEALTRPLIGRWDEAHGTLAISSVFVYLHNSEAVTLAAVSLLVRSHWLNGASSDPFQVSRAVSGHPV